MARLDDLACYKAGQGFDWVETSVLRANGLPVMTSANSETLYGMLAAGRFDYFPRPLRPDCSVDAQTLAQMRPQSCLRE